MKQPPPARQVFLQDCASKLFVVEANRWTSDLEKARDFGTTREAVVYALAHRLPGVQLMIHFSSEALTDVVVPVSCDAENTAW
jgi:hypothetical protein